NGIVSDVWALSLAGSPAWSALAPAGSPPAARYGHTASYDPVRDRMVVFGGFGRGSSLLGDVCAMSLADSPVWTRHTPSGRSYPTAIHDPARDRMVVFGGDQRCFCNDVWALSTAASPTWTPLTPTGTPPPTQ